MNHVELFAGCGGLSLGLESVNFEMLMANELSPMASETFAYNFFGENLLQIAGMDPSLLPLRTKWLSSNFSANQLSKRLRENPQTFPLLGTGHSDIEIADDLEGKLIVGSIIQLNDWLSINQSAKEKLKDGFGRGGIDLVSGGPPCQSFSMAGLRDFSNHRNVLPWEFARFVSMVQPRFALLENVTGILRPFEIEGEKVYAWFEVAKAFAEIGYVPLCLHVNAKFAGVAQNRPRFIMLLLRKDVFREIKPTLNQVESSLLNPSEDFFNQMSAGITPNFGSLPYFDAAKSNELANFENSFLRPLVEYVNTPFSVKDAIDDLRGKGHGNKSQYLKKLDESFPSPHIAHQTLNVLPNNEHRRNSAIVKGRFRIYQVLQSVSKAARNEASKVLSGELTSLSKESSKELLEYIFGTENEKIKFSSTVSLVNYLRAHPTKKQTQRALEASSPAPAALSIPDDACHYHEFLLRTLTVREMARIQSFPDKFVFRSKVTTGGQSRKFEVPQYTQVGNAVPPLLGRALGLVVKDLANRCNKSDKKKKQELIEIS